MTHSAFFYGTLLHPTILRRVIGHKGDQLEMCPALLLDHTRHKIRHADYPAVLPYAKSRTLFIDSGRGDLPPEERTVRGTLVRGLSNEDIARLDLFEGDEYTREAVAVHPLEPLAPLSSTPVPRSDPSAASNGATDADVTYIYAGPLRDLSPELWSYDDFVRENAWKWVGTGEREEYYAEVDRRREMDGKTLHTAIVDAGNGPAGSAANDRAVVAEFRE
ncbi:hypothetical protein C8Q70DRAFT_966296 [Cubamyces menziesii]|nr:hypothetical protein C8Q70DRAFT_966296 [Cubamyces menziesii]